MAFVLRPGSLLEATEETEAAMEDGSTRGPGGSSATEAATAEAGAGMRSVRPPKYRGTLFALFPSWSPIRGVSMAVSGGGKEKPPAEPNGLAMSRRISCTLAGPLVVGF